MNFEIAARKIEPTPGGDDTYVKLDLLLGEPDEDEPEERSADHEWGGLGFAFCIQMLSFADARPRGASDMDFVAKDELTVLDMIEHFRFENGELQVSIDYLRGRCLKTEVVIRRDGSATITTRNRGEAALHWLDRVKGEKMLELVK